MSESGRHEQPPDSTVAMYQRITRSANEAARLKAAHRYCQRTTYRTPFRNATILGAGNR